MSFLYDKNVYEKLIKFAQTVPAAAPSADAVAVAKKLVNSLSLDLSGTPKPPDITSAKKLSDPVYKGGPTREIPTILGVKNLQNLSSFALFLSDNELAINGVRLAYGAGMWEILPPEEKDKYIPITLNATRDESGKFSTTEKFINKNAVILYVNTLQQSAAEMQKNPDDAARGKILQVMLGKIIDELKTKDAAGFAALNRKVAKSTPESPSDLPDDTKLDQLDKLFDISKTYATGTTVLTAGNIKSVTDLNAWLGTSPPAQSVSKDAKGAVITSTFPDPNFNACTMINILYLRAKNLANRPMSTEAKKSADFYLKKIQELGPGFAGPDNKACTINGMAGTGVTGTAGTGAGTGTGSGADGALTAERSKIVSRIVQSLPLRNGIIDLNKISMFTGLYKQLDSSQNTPITSILTSSQDVKELTANGSAIYNLSYLDTSMGSFVKNRSDMVAQAIKICELLRYIIDSTLAIISLFSSNYKDKLTDDQQRYLDSQLNAAESNQTDLSQKLAHYGVK